MSKLPNCSKLIGFSCLFVAPSSVSLLSASLPLSLEFFVLGDIASLLSTKPWQKLFFLSTPKHWQYKCLVFYRLYKEVDILEENWNTDKENKDLVLSSIWYHGSESPLSIPHREHHWVHFLVSNHTKPVLRFILFPRTRGLYLALSPQVQDTYTHGMVPAKESKNSVSMYSVTRPTSNLPFSLLHYCYCPFFIILINM